MTSDWETYTETPTRRRQWSRSWISRENKIRTITVSISTINRKKSPFVISIYVMLAKEDLVVLANLSQLMAEKWRDPFRMCEAL